MQSDYTKISEPNDLVLHLLSLAYLYGDFAIVFHFMNTSSQAYLSVQKGDIAALRKFASRNWIDFDQLSEEKRQQLNQHYEMIKEKYGAQIETKLAPLPAEFLSELGNRALTFGRFMDAHSCFKANNELDKHVNQLLNEAVQNLSSKEVTASEANFETIDEKIFITAELVFQAVKLKNPFGNQFQILGYNLHFEDFDVLRKYSKYIEQSLFKEIIEFGIQYLIDDKSISSRVVNALASGKIRRSFLKNLALHFSGDKEKFFSFIQNYQKSVEKLKVAKEERDYLDVPRILMGRGTGDNSHFQYLRELALEHPVSSLLVTTRVTPNDKNYIAPIILKSGQSLLEFLEFV